MLGKIAPNFVLKDQNGNNFELYKNLDKPVLLVFYPKDDSSVCSRQLANYQENLNLLEKNNIKLVGINTGSQQSHLSFCNKLGLEFPLLSDTKKEVSRKYGALNFLNINKRKLVLINIDKKVLYEESFLPFNFANTEQVVKKINFSSGK